MDVIPGDWSSRHRLSIIKDGKHRHSLYLLSQRQGSSIGHFHSVGVSWKSNGVRNQQSHMQSRLFDIDDVLLFRWSDIVLHFRDY